MLLLAWLLAGTPGLDKAHVPDGLMACLRHAAFQPRQKELFGAWEKAAREVRTLAIEFDLKEEDSIHPEGKPFHGRLLLRRTPRGVLGRYEFRPPEKDKEPFVALLLGDKLYLLRTANKTAIRIDLAGVNICRWLEKWFNPFVLPLDRERAQWEWRWNLAKEDSWYTYLDVQPRKRQGRSSFLQTYKEDDSDSGWSFVRARIVVMNKGDDKIPRNMPRRIWIRQVTSDITFDIVRWTMDGPEAPSDKDFTEPEKMEGWKVLDNSEVFQPMREPRRGGRQ